MPKAWEIRRYSAEDEGLANTLATQLGLYPAIGRLLVDRGIRSKEQAQDFFAPSLEQLHDPFLLEDMDKAVVRLNKAVERGEHILIYGDYDVDGTTSVALLYRYLRSHCLSAEHLHYYIPILPSAWW